MKPGPKPKPKGKCESCNKLCNLTRNLCSTCYSRKLKNGEIQKLPNPILPETFTEIQNNIIVGSLLGDGCLFRHRPTHKPHLLITRTKSDKAYCEWQANILNPFVCFLKDYETYDKRTKKIYYSTRLRTRRSQIFNSYYQDWYPSPDEIKRIPDNLILNPLILAIWFADDGSIKSTYSPWRLCLKLATHGFLLNDTEKLCSMLCKRYNEYFGVQIDEGNAYITTADAGTRQFLKEIDGYLPISMNRKARWRKKEARFYKNIPLKSTVYPTLRKTHNGIRDIPLTPRSTVNH